MRSAVLISSGPQALGEITQDAVQAEFPEASPQLAALLLGNMNLINLARKTRGTVQTDYGSRLPVSSTLLTWFDVDHTPSHARLLARCPEIDTLLLVSNRLGKLVKAYQPLKTPEGVMFSVPVEDLRSPHSTVMAVVPIPDGWSSP